MGEEKKREPQGAGSESMFVMLAYLMVLITAISCVYSLM
jgi:flagellar basal body-associated protein FliL